jgi:predicted house-cleaning NTP pyrophosphatase (Maf/HAM1 superfamily)
MGKVGAYGIEGIGGSLITGISGMSIFQFSLNLKGV